LGSALSPDPSLRGDQAVRGLRPPSHHADGAAPVQGGDPNSLPTARASLETAGKGLKEICDAAVKTVTPNTKGVWEGIAKGAVEPLIKTISDGVGALWTRHVEKDKLEIETKKTQLEAAKWPKFSEIVAQ
jgi:hypothetical protein